MKEYTQQTFFEEDYIARTTGSVTLKPDVALTELIANAWDAGASVVNINITENDDKEIIIEDNGTGMTKEQFNTRWMVLSYNRIKSQGINVEFPLDFEETTKRRAYGKNGIGRHSMFCFSNTYKLETWRNGILFSCDIVVSQGEHPYKVYNVKEGRKDGHGTKLSTYMKRNYPNDIQYLTDVLSARFLYDPKFIVKVNNKLIDLTNHSGIEKEDKLIINDDVNLKITIINSESTAKNSLYHGVAFWVGKRLVGEPSWELGKYVVRDGRTKMAKRYTIIVQTEDLYNEVKQDWTGFHNTELMELVYEKLYEYINQYIRSINASQIEDTKLEIVKNQIRAIEELPRIAQDNLAEFINDLVEQEPEKNIEEFESAVSVMIKIEKTRSGKELLKKISSLSEESIETLNTILDDWDINDIKVTLDSIDNRILVITAIERLCNDTSTDELHTLHPLVAQAKWLFGPEYDSEMYTFNRQLKTIIKNLLKNNKYIEMEDAKKRPDLVVFENSFFETYFFEDKNEQTDIFETKRILIIELKKGGFTITQEEMNQAQNYVNKIYNSTSIPSKPKIYAYVVGAKIDNDCSKFSKTEKGETYAHTYLELVSTAKQRLFRLKEILTDRYDKMTDDNIVSKVLKESRQLDIIDINKNNINR